jgi:uncharacterized protein
VTALRRPRLAARLGTLLHLDDPPGKIALALAVGVFIGCTPFWGLQTLLSAAVAWACRLNRAAAITGTWLNLPWIAPLVYGAALKVGGLLVPDPDGLRAAWLDYLLEHWQSVSWHDALALFRELSVALLVGSAVVGGVAALGTYAIAFTVLSARRARRGGRTGGTRRVA